MHPLDFPISAIGDPLRVSGKFFRSGEQGCFIKAVTFGPFPAGAFPDEARAELVRVKTELGANAIRIYEIPTREFMHECAEQGLRVFLSIPWSQHIDFFREPEVLAEAEQTLIETVEKFRGHPALAGYFVGNEIETTLVRWMGRRRVLEAIEDLIDLGHQHDPDALFSYANYPSTEYLLPQNQDFVAFNLYLEDRVEFANYLARLQNLAGDKPLLISEFGVDSQSKGEAEQTEILQWHVTESAKAGVAGTTLFAWSDQWQRGGRTIEDYSFGLVRRDNTAKPAMEAIQNEWADWQGPSSGIEDDNAPMVSVLVCTYRGTATLVECLDSLRDLNYPSYEVIVVNDGADERVAELVGEYPEVQLLSIPRGGLSVARNAGAEAAQGDLFVYMDDDCVAEKDWLWWLAKQFEGKPSVGCAGGPNIPPVPDIEKEALVIAAPGGPSHVLLTDTTAEHLPGCNLAVRREAFDAVGGFNPIFRSAGDDVDFCWRVIEAGYELSFHAAAFIWHYRRSDYRRYFKQQIGYGRAEALLMPLHRERFKGLGGAVWKGAMYLPHLSFDGVVYHGRYGYEPFQLIYPDAESGLGGVTLHVVWWGLFVGLAAFSWVSPWFTMLALLMLAGSVATAWRRASRADLASAFESIRGRLILIGLILIQGVLRSGARFKHGWKEAKWSRGFVTVSGAAWKRIASGWWKLGAEQQFWSDEGVGRDQFLAEILNQVPGAVDDETGKTDLILQRTRFWNWAVITANEYHENEGRLTRVRLLARPELLTRMIVLPLLVIIPVATVAFFGFRLESLLIAAVCFGAAALTKLFLASKRPTIEQIADAVGLKSA